jgi:O-antigen/teichoic acid export membrane protein
LNTDKVKQLWGFGKWLLGSSILLFFILQGDDLFVGKMLGITALGFYQVAYRIANLPTTEITHAISQVTYPAYSRLKEDKARLRQAFLKVFQITILFSFAAGGLLFVLAHDFTKIFLGKEWLPMVPAMQILIPAGIARSVMATTGPIFKAMGKPGIATKWQIVRLGILACLIYPFILKWQLVGVSLAVLLSNLLSTVGFCFSVLKILECRFKIFLKIITPPILLFAGMTAGMKLMNLTTYDIGIVEFSLLAVSQLCLVVVFVYLFEKFFDYNIKPLLTKAIGGIIGS